MKPFYYLIIYFRNGKDFLSFDTYTDAMQYARNNISYSGGRVLRVELGHSLNNCALWDKTWDALSQAKGLENVTP